MLPVSAPPSSLSWLAYVRAVLEFGVPMALMYAFTCLLIVAFDTTYLTAVQQCYNPATHTTTNAAGVPLLASWSCIYNGLACLVSGSLATQPQQLPHQHQICTPIQLVVAPLSNLMYNSQTTNLAKHGLHPRYLHMLVNMQLLFGPLFIIVIIGHVWAHVRHATTNTWAVVHGKFGVRRNGRHRVQQRIFAQQPFLVMSSVIFPLMVLSTVPHQEPRFLLPLVIPIALAAGIAAETSQPKRCLKDKAESLHASTTQDRTKCCRKHGLVVLWVVFNGVMVVLFGGLHQAGVLRALVHINNSESASDIYISSTLSSVAAPGTAASVGQDKLSELAITSTAKRFCVAGLKVYSLPRFLLSAMPEHADVRDWGSTPLEDVVESLMNPCKQEGRKWMLLFPGSMAALVESALETRGLKLINREHFFPHLTMEAPPTALSVHELSLVVAQVGMMEDE
jgi:hypothetical protein